MKSKSIILLAVSLGFGLVAAFGISQVLGRGGKQVEAPKERMMPVLIAKETIDQHAILDEENIEVKEWPESLVPDDALTSLDDLKDMVARSRIPKNSPILLDHAVTKEASGRIDIKPGHTVVAINVDAEDTLGGLLKQGHYVDIMAVFQVPNGKVGGVFAQTFLRNIRVFSIDSETALSEEQGASAAATVIGLEVTKKQAEKILLVQRVASLKIALVGTKPVLHNNEDKPSMQDITDIAQVLGLRGDNSSAEDAQVAQTARANQRDNSNATNHRQSFLNGGENDGKKYSMVIFSQSGTQTYRWREGEVPMLDNPVTEAAPENAPPMDGLSPVPPVSGNEQGNPEAKSGSNSKIPEDEFDE